jgi:integrase
LKLRNELPEYLRVPVTIASWTGMRLGETRMLRWDQIDWYERLLRLNPGETKNNEGRSVSLDGEPIQMLLELRRKSKTQRIFGDEREPGQFRKSWRKACERAGLGKFMQVGSRTIYTGLCFQDLRRSSVRNLIRAVQVNRKQ